MLVLGLDGATWNVILPHRRSLPAFSSLLDTWDHGTLVLDQKPWSAPIWTSMFSGLEPEEHHHHDFARNGSLVRREDLPFPFVWDRLSAQGRRGVALNVPFVMPPYSFGVLFAPPADGLPVSPDECREEVRALSGAVRDAYRSAPELVVAVITALDRISHRHWGGTRSWSSTRKSIASCRVSWSSIRGS